MNFKDYFYRIRSKEINRLLIDKNRTTEISISLFDVIFCQNIITGPTDGIFGRMDENLGHADGTLGHADGTLGQTDETFRRTDEITGH